MQIYSGCFTSKGCFGMPSGCESSGRCKVLAAYAPAEDGKFSMALHGRGFAPGQYMALGLSRDGAMGDDLTLACLPGEGRVVAGWNDGKNNQVRAIWSKIMREGNTIASLY